MRTRRLLASVTAPVVALLLMAGCGDDGGGGGDLSAAEQEFADAWSLTLQDEEDGFGVPAADADCMGAAIMAELGTGPFDDADVTPADIDAGADEANSPGEVVGDGVISDAQADAILDAWGEDCVELTTLLAESARADFELDDDGVTCFADGLGEGTLARDLLRPSFTSGDDTPDEEVLSDVIALLDTCGGGVGSSLVTEIADELSADGSITEADATCIAQGVVDEIGAERLTELTAGGSFEEAGAAAQAEISGALITAAGACDVPISAFGG